MSVATLDVIAVFQQEFFEYINEAVIYREMLPINVRLILCIDKVWGIA